MEDKNNSKDDSPTQNNAKNQSETVSKLQKQKRKEKHADSDENGDVNIDLSIIDEIMDGKDEYLFYNRNKHADDALKLFFSNKNLNSLIIENKDAKVNMHLKKMINNNYENKTTFLEWFEVGDIRDAFRKSVYVLFRNETEIYEGEVINIKMLKNDSGDVNEIEMTLKTNKSSKTFKVDKYLANSLSNINLGDVIYIEPNGGFIKRLGRSENCINEYDLEGDKYVQLNKQPVNIKKKRNIYVSLYDIDFSTNKYSDKISDITRERTNEMVEEYIESGVGMLEECCIVISSFEKLSESKIRTLVTLHMEMPWVKIVLVGNLENYDYSLLNDFSKIQLKDLSPIDYLKLKHNNFSEFESVVNQYLEKISIEVMSDIINLSENKDEFIKLIDVQLGSNKNAF